MAVFEIRDAEPRDVDSAVAALAEAFADDPLMRFLFHDHPQGIGGGATTFFSILLRARIALRMPARVLLQRGAVQGAVMGYDTSRPEWSSAITAEWERFEGGVAGLAGRMAAYDAICAAHQPTEAHHYLGVIGVHPALQGAGAGKAMLEAFCNLSRKDPGSQGVYLDTTNPSSLEFYYRNGFELRGQGDLDGVPVWCVYRPT